MADLTGLLKRGLNRPEKIPRYLFGLLVPSSRWGPEWRKRDGLVLFEAGGYASSPRNRPEFAANLYREVSGLRAAIAARCGGTPDRALEIGCGYGRLAPWIAEEMNAYHGIDPDGHALATAAEQYPDLGFARGRAGSLPYLDDAFDLVVTWTVLQHVDDGAINDATAEIVRVLAPGGTVCCCERTRPPADDHIWPRSIDRYRSLFDPLELVDVRDRPVERTWDESMGSTRPPERLLTFRG